MEGAVEQQHTKVEKSLRFQDNGAELRACISGGRVGDMVGF